MQINSGLINVVAGDGTVVGNSSVDWTQVTTSSLIIIGGQTYDILSVDALAKEIEISPVYAGATASGVPYAIVRDFTLNHNLPLLNPGDLEAAAIVSRALSTIDRLLSLGTGSADLGEILITKTAHGFIVGNFLTLSGTDWVLSLSDTSAHSVIVGVVKEVVSVNQFKIVTQGRISNVAGITLTPGTVYYLRNASTPGGGGNVNITDNLAFAGLQVPVLVAETSTDGWILNLARAQTGVFGLLSGGIVPGPTADDISNGRVLGAGGGWTSVGIANNSLAVQHLLSGGSVNWANFALKQTGLSVFEHLLDLNSRLTALSAYSRRTKIAVGTRTKADPGTGSGSFTVPPRVSSIKLRVISGSIPVSATTSGTGTVSTELIHQAYEFVMDVSEGNSVSWVIGQAHGYVYSPDFEAEDQARVRVYLDGVLAIDVQPIKLVGGIATALSSNFPSYDNTKAKFLSVLPSQQTLSVISMYDFTYAQINPFWGELILDDSTSVYKEYRTPLIITNSRGGILYPGGKGLYVSAISGAVQIVYED